MMVLLGCSIPLGKIMKEHNDWFRETRFRLWEAMIQTEAPVLVGWLLFSTNMTNTDILKREISRFIEDIPVGLRWKMIWTMTKLVMLKMWEIEFLDEHSHEMGMSL